MKCPSCDGLGYEELSDDIGLYLQRCGTCNGDGEIIGVALVHLRNRGSDLVTVEYVYRFLHIARNFIDGWEAYQYTYPARNVIVYPRYAQLRDYLLGFDADWITACQVALFLDPETTWNYYRELRGYPTNAFMAVV